MRKGESVEKAATVLPAVVFLAFFVLWAASAMARPYAYVDVGGNGSIETVDHDLPNAPLPDGRIFLRYVGSYPRDLSEDPYSYVPTETLKRPPITLLPPFETEDAKLSCQTPPLRFGRR
jgi:hypothetical protein